MCPLRPPSTPPALSRAPTVARSNLKMRRAFAKSFQYDTALLSLLPLVVVAVVMVVVAATAAAVVLSAPIVVSTLLA